MNISYEDLILMIDISRAMSCNPALVDEDTLTFEWSPNKYKTPDVIVNFEKRHMIVDNTEGHRLYYSASLFNEMAGIALLNNMVFFEDSYYITENSEQTNTED
jgi:hypothetical protein